MNKKERARVIRDITRWKAEYEEGYGNNFNPEELSDFVREMGRKNDDELVKAWHSSVGEWVLSRSDLDIPDDYDSWLDEQLEKLKSGKDVDYGYLASCQVEVSEIENIIRN